MNVNSTTLTLALNFNGESYLTLFAVDFGQEPDEAPVIVASARWAYEHGFLRSYLLATERAHAAQLTNLLRVPKALPAREHPARPPRNPFLPKAIPDAYVPIVRGRRRH